MALIKLNNIIEGTGEVKGITYTKVVESDLGYIYKASDPEMTHEYYEVFEKKISPVCIDFEKKLYSETDFKESYPKSNAFGLWAWTTKDFEKAKRILQSFTVKDKENV